MNAARDFLDALGIKLARYTEGSHKALCPKCSARRSHQKEPCLYVKITSEGCGFHCFNCGWKGGLNDGRGPHASNTAPPTRDTNCEAALRIWREAKIGALPYLAERGITLAAPLTLRRHGALLHKGTGLRLCGMVAAVQLPRGEIAAIHRTFLTSDWRRKASVSNVKMALGALGAGAVRLAAASEEVGIAEGVESGLSAMQLFDVPVWCALGSERLHKIELPPEVRRVVIFGDNGPAGHKAAMRAVRPTPRKAAR